MFIRWARSSTCSARSVATESTNPVRVSPLRSAAALRTRSWRSLTRMLMRPWRTGSADPMTTIVQLEYVQDKVQQLSTGPRACPGPGYGGLPANRELHSGSAVIGPMRRPGVPMRRRNSASKAGLLVSRRLEACQGLLDLGASLGGFASPLLNVDRICVHEPLEE